MTRAKYGPTSGAAFRASPRDERRFWSRVEKREGCWMWTGVIVANGYGSLMSSQLGRPVNAHRMAYAIHHGEVPAGQCVMHSCDNPGCVNPEHLRLGTHRQNMQDMCAKGRAYWQRRTHCAKGHALTEENVRLTLSGRRHCQTCRRASIAKCNARVTHRRIIGWLDHVQAALREYLPPTYAGLVELTDERRADVLSRTYGLYGMTPASMDETAKLYGFSRERARQIRNTALAQLGIPYDTAEMRKLLGSSSRQQPEQDALAAAS